MKSTVLEKMKSPDFVTTFGFIATPPALHRMLARSREVAAVREAIDSGGISEQSIRNFVGEIMRGLRCGEPLEHDLALAAIAVALERYDIPFAREFLEELADLHTVEMNKSVRVAKECLKSQKFLSGTITAKYVSEPGCMYGDGAALIPIWSDKTGELRKELAWPA